MASTRFRYSTTITSSGLLVLQAVKFLLRYKYLTCINIINRQHMKIFFCGRFYEKWISYPDPASGYVDVLYNG